MAHPLIRMMEENPVVPALKDAAQIDACDACPGGIVFVLCGDILCVGELIEKIHRAGKKAVIHADLIHGLAQKEIAADFLHRCGADGIISTRPHIVRRGRELGMLSVLRVFIIDSKALSNLKNEVETGRPDMVEVLPGTICSAIGKLSTQVRVPLIAGGLLESKQDVVAALRAGALCVSSSNPELWRV